MAQQNGQRTSTKPKRRFTNAGLVKQQAHNSSRQDDAFERLRQRIKEMNHG